ncbi:unnamed protein product [Zymoseptoria tritici ST99CH_3D1]|uniref:Ribosomal protein L22 n=3 Tax=Zymoseptoria tritici TaxID=1047171 RepID=A0A1X7RDU1_ZYMT9|nr:unnamed protein product [Zymoseptoria tritici ST99CH_3D7]SMR41917.1 unnamed protein product [Zymoseptoria tritici ST99CH_1E4]SMR44105.1 unnamed protein product [Zymoseptoria tritici ST99CH_3D1]
MSLSAPSRRLASLCLSCNPPISTTTLAHRTRIPIDAALRRTLSSSQPRRADSTSSDKPNPILEEWKRKNPGDAAAGKRPSLPAGGLTPQSGDIAASSIFEDERRAQEQKDAEDAEGAEGEEEPGVTKVGGIRRNSEIMARLLDPNPAAREKWEKKMVVRSLRKGGRLNKALFLKRTEREHLSKSHNLKTSVKKLGMVARQIAGKTLDDAIVQMRFSKKKVAIEVLEQLEKARDEAVVMRGMGLGLVGASKSARDEANPAKDDKPLEIQLKDGKRHKISDPSAIYIDQAWVGRGPYGKLPDYRARGRVFIMRTPWTSLSLVLKEEATRVREFEEREEKRKKAVTRNVWKHLPDRPVQLQRQWYSW